MKNVKRYFILLKKLARIRFSNQPGKNCAYRRTIFYEFKDWGGVYIKFLQIVAGMSKFMEGWAGPKEMSVFSQAPYEPLDISQEIDLTKFANVETTPFAAGSFALVFRGTLKTDETVAIKILRPSIRKNLRKDLAHLRKLCWLFSRFLPDLLVNYNEAYAACAQMFMLETDYHNEMANQKYFADFYKNHPRVTIPQVYAELSSRYVIVQDYIAGPTLADVMSQATPEKSAAELTKVEIMATKMIMAIMGKNQIQTKVPLLSTIPLVKLSPPTPNQLLEWEMAERTLSQKKIAKA